MFVCLCVCVFVCLFVCLFLFGQLVAALQEREGALQATLAQRDRALAAAQSEHAAAVKALRARLSATETKAARQAAAADRLAAGLRGQVTKMREAAEAATAKAKKATARAAALEKELAGLRKRFEEASARAEEAERRVGAGQSAERERLKSLMGEKKKLQLQLASLKDELLSTQQDNETLREKLKKVGGLLAGCVVSRGVAPWVCVCAWCWFIMPRRWLLIDLSVLSAWPAVRCACVRACVWVMKYKKPTTKTNVPAGGTECSERRAQGAVRGRRGSRSQETRRHSRAPREGP